MGLSSKVKIHLENGIVHYVWHKGVIIDKELLEEAVTKRMKLTKGTAYPIFCDFRGVEYWTKDSREILSSPKVLNDVIAYGVVVNNDAMEIIINWVKNFVIPGGLPAEVFLKEEDALKWLEQFKTSSSAD